MPPRIPLLQCLRTSNGTSVHRHTHAGARIDSLSVPAASLRPFTTSAASQASTQRRRHRDPYAIAQSKAKQAANRSRQEVLREERALSLGNPVRGVTTPYLESFDTATPPETSTTNDALSEQDPASRPLKADLLNFYLDKSELSTGLEHSRLLSTPAESTVPSPDQLAQEATSIRADDTTPEELAESRKRTAEVASEALRRIASLEIGSSKDRLRANKQRCIADFGRHNTDDVLPRLKSTQPVPASALPKTPRVGPDTGSSEVQIAILTAKIRTLADFLDTRGRMDKVNKRNLRLLVHRRQKLLRYLERKERGGPRFANVVKTLGLTEGTWKEEISL